LTLKERRVKRARPDSQGILVTTDIKEWRETKVLWVRRDKMETMQKTETRERRGQQEIKEDKVTLELTPSREHKVTLVLKELLESLVTVELTVTMAKMER